MTCNIQLYSAFVLHVICVTVKINKDIFYNTYKRITKKRMFFIIFTAFRNLRVCTFGFYYGLAMQFFVKANKGEMFSIFHE